MGGAFRALLRWELLSYLRNKAGLFWSAVFPFVLLTVLLSAFGEGKEHAVRVTLINQDGGAYAGSYARFLDERLTQAGARVSLAGRSATRDARGMSIVIPAGFAADRSNEIAAHFDVNVRAPERAILGVIADATNDFAWARVGSAPPIKLRPMPNLNTRTFDYAGYVMTGILVVSMLSTCIMGAILPLAARREGHLLRIFSAFPVRASTVMWSILTSRVVLVFGFGAIFLLGAHLLYGVALPARGDGWLSLAAVSAVGSFTFLSLALAVASRVGNIQTATIVSNLVYMPLILFSDLTLPLANFPQIVQTVSDFLPVHAFVEAIRGIILSGDTLLQHGRAVLVLALWAAGFCLIGRRLFALQSA